VLIKFGVEIGGLAERHLEMDVLEESAVRFAQVPVSTFRVRRTVRAAPLKFSTSDQAFIELCDLRFPFFGLWSVAECTRRGGLVSSGLAVFIAPDKRSVPAALE
jgi:hypothetical protein